MRQRSRQITSLLLFIALLIVAPKSYASKESLRQNLQNLTSRLTQNAGVFAASLDKKDVLFEKNAGNPLNPASTTKIVVAAAALKYLGPDYKFHTQFFITPEEDLYVVGHGDPSLVIEEITMIADKLRQKGLKSIRHIVVNDEYFDRRRPPGLPGPKSYNNPYTSALSLNFNRLRVDVRPSGQVGKEATVIADAGEQTEIDIINRVKTVRGGRTTIDLSPPKDKGDDFFIVSGQIPARSKMRSYQFYVSLPPLYLASTLKKVLEENNCHVQGAFYTGPKPSGSRLILDHESKPLSEIVKDMNKFSNNFIASQLVKTLGARFAGTPGSTAKGIEVISRYLTNLNIPSREFYLVNGSGLTYDNRLSAHLLVKVIADMYNNRNSWAAFWDSLSIAGKDGTLKRRFRTKPLYLKLRAKTGSVNRVKTITGAVTAKNGEMIGYAILLNGTENMNGRHELMEEIVTEIANFSR